MIPNYLWALYIDFSDPSNKFNEDSFEEVKGIQRAPPQNWERNIQPFIKDFFLNFIVTADNWDHRFICNKEDVYYWMFNTSEVMQSDKEIEGDQKALFNILHHNYIKPAHKSDVIRYFLLKYYGGLWIDSTTILFENPYKFIGPYDCIIPYMGTSFGLKLVFAEFLKFQYTNKFIDKNSFISKINYDTKKVHFIPENYFLGSVKYHPIMVDVLNQLKELWSDKNLLTLTSEDAITDFLAEYIREISYNKLFTYTDDKLDYLAKNSLNIWKWNTYLFNYIQLYIAIMNYKCKKYNSIDNCYKERFEEQALWDKGWKEFTNALCIVPESEFNVCNNLQLKCKDNNLILLLAVTYARLFRFSPQKDDERWQAGFKKSFIQNKVYDIIRKSEDCKDLQCKEKLRMEFIETMTKNQIPFVKVSSSSVKYPKQKHMFWNMLEIMLGKPIFTSYRWRDWELSKPPPDPTLTDQQLLLPMHNVTTHMAPPPPSPPPPMFSPGRAVSEPARTTVFGGKSRKKKRADKYNKKLTKKRGRKHRKSKRQAKVSNKRGTRKITDRKILM